MNAEPKISEVPRLNAEQVERESRPATELAGSVWLIFCAMFIRASLRKFANLLALPATNAQQGPTLAAWSGFQGATNPQANDIQPAMNTQRNCNQTTMNLHPTATKISVFQGNFQDMTSQQANTGAALPDESHAQQRRGFG